MNTNDEKYRYFAYIRKSSEQDDRQMLSIPAQKDELLRIVKRDELTIIDWYEESRSAKAPGRKLFNEMLKRMKKGEANGILTWHVNRLSRNSKDTGEIVYLFDQKIIGEVLTPTQRFRNTPDDKFMLGFFGGQAKHENDTKSRDVTRGLKRKANMGWLPSGAVVGYLNTPDRVKGCKTLLKDSERFHLVRRMWDLMLTGNYTVPQIWKITQEWGFKTARRGKVGGRLLARSTVYSIFTNPFYYGWFEYPRGSGMWIQGKHDPMITREEFDHVQRLLGREDRPRPKTKRNFSFSGLIKCRTCGASITAESKTKRQKNGNVHKYTYYHCTKRKDETCPERSIEIKELEKQIRNILSDIHISEKFKEWSIRHLHEIRTNEAESNEILLKRKHIQHEQIVNQISSLTLKYTSPDNIEGDLISNQEYQSLKGSLLTQKASLESELKIQSEELNDWVKLTEKTFNFACYAQTWFEKGDQKAKRAVLSALGSNLFLNDRKLQVELHPYLQILHLGKERIKAETLSDRTSKKALNKGKTGAFAPVSSMELTTRVENYLKPYVLGKFLGSIWALYNPIGSGSK